MVIQLKSKQDLEIMRKSGMIVYEILQELSSIVKPGISTWEVDQKAKDLTKKYGAKPAFLNYPSATKGVPDFPGVICASVNEEIVHGIPNKKPLKEGDILSIDYGCVYEGFFGDSAVTVAVGKISEQNQELLDVTKQSLEDAISQCLVGNRIGDISEAVQRRCEKNGFGVIRDFVGHGIGRNMHEPPAVPNFGKAGEGRVLKEGMVLAIEPMVSAGSYHIKILDDGWTAITADHSMACHFEHTIAMTAKGPWVLTRP